MHEYERKQTMRLNLPMFGAAQGHQTRQSAAGRPGPRQAVGLRPVQACGRLCAAHPAGGG